MPKARGGLGRFVVCGRQPAENLRAYKRHWAKVRHSELRAELLAAYGNKCWCCGEKEGKFLTLDHLNNDGHLDRRLCQNGTTLYMKLKRASWPQDGYALACYNCNCGRAQNSGVCPHKGATHGS